MAFETRRIGQRRGRRRGAGGRPADKYSLYQRSVQEPDADCDLIERIFRGHFGKAPRLLREDFCGTALLACRWAARHGENRAWAIDLDPEPLAWGRAHNLAALTADQASRVELIEGDVRGIGHEKVDVTVAFNFSYFLFQAREELLAYLRKAWGTLRAQGLLVLDAYGGADSQRTCQERRPVDGFHYVWDQHLFDPIRNRAVNYIHFELPGGRRMRRAFRYDWRLWSLPELRELLGEAGFSKVDVYWEGTEGKSGEGNGIFTRRRSAPDDPAWVSYIAAAKGA